MSKKFVYVASPVRAVLEEVCFNTSRANEIIRKLAREGCIKVKNAGHIPVSPVFLFGEVFDEFTERELIDQACEDLLLSCDELMVVQSSYNTNSKGIQREIKIAKENGITQVEY